MGITIHYSFVKRENPKSLLNLALLLAQKLNWKILEDKKNCLILHPTEECESVELRFMQIKNVRKIKEYDYITNIFKDFDFDEKYDKDVWVCTMFCKTQYAGVKTHIQVAEFLRVIASFCSDVKIHDEADYYEKGRSKKSIEDTAKEFDSSTKMISGLSRQLKEVFGEERVLSSVDGDFN